MGIHQGKHVNRLPNLTWRVINSVDDCFYWGPLDSTCWGSSKNKIDFPKIPAFLEVIFQQEGKAINKHSPRVGSVGVAGRQGERPDSPGGS